jgi:hypothetical protein
MKALLNVVLVAFLGVAVYGLGGGPEWLRYVGWGTVMLLLLLILQGVSNIPNLAEQRKMFGEAQRPVFEAELDAPEAQTPQTTASRRSNRN